MTMPGSGGSPPGGSSPPVGRSPAAATSAASPATSPVREVGGEERNQLLRGVAAVFGNVAVFTALLVYFGWVRSEVQARRLGIDESILGMSTRDYLLRSVRPVLVLLLVVAGTGLVWVVVDRWLMLRLRNNAQDPAYRWAIRTAPLGLLGLPLLAWVAGFVWPATAYIAFPLCCAAGLLLVLYAFYLRQARPGAVPLPPGRDSLLRVGTLVVVAVALFTAAANYATVEGTQLARAFQQQLPTMTRVVVYSSDALHINAPGVDVQPLPGRPAKFRYTGLRLLEHTGGRYFLVSDGWTRKYGVVVVLRDDDSSLRLEFVRDLR